MRVAVIGSRNVTPDALEQLLRAIPAECSEIVSGGARGADSLAREAAGRLFVPLTEFLPEYETFGRAAPIRRNRQIVEYCDFLIAVWDGDSPGTRDALLCALRLQRPVKVLITGKKSAPPPPGAAPDEENEEEVTLP